MNDLVVMLVPPAMAGGFKDVVQELLRGKRFNAPVLYSVDQAFELVGQGKMQLWIFAEQGSEPFFFALTEICDYPAGRTVRVALVAGKHLRRAIAWLPQFHLWCKMQGATYVEAITDPRIARLTRKVGYVPTGISVHHILQTFH